MKTTSIHNQINGRSIAPENRPIINAMAVVLAMLTFGAATSHSADYTPEPTPAAPAGLGRIGIGYGGSLPQFDLQIPDTKLEAAEDKAGEFGLHWAREDHEGIRNEAQGIGVLAEMALTPVSMLAGATYGTFAGASGRKLKPALTVLTNIMTELQVQEALRSQLLRLIQQRSPQPLTLMTNPFPAESAFRVPSLMDTIAPLPFSFAAQRQKQECGPSAFEGIDTLLMIRVVNHGLSGRDGHNSQLALNMAVRVTLIRAQDRTQLSGFYAQFDSPKRRFIKWAVNDGQAFRAEMECGLHSLADQIIAQSGLLAPQAPPAPTGIVQASRNN